MPAQITMPQLSDTMSEGTLIKWYKKPGDKVSAGDKLADVETDKAVMEWEAYDEHEGTLAKVLVNEGQKAKVGETLAVVATKGEKVEDVAKSAGNASSAKSAAPQRTEPSGSAAGSSSGGTKGVSPPGNNRGGDGKQPDAGRDPDTTAASLPRGAPIEQGRAQERRETTQTSPNRSSEDLAREATAAISNRGNGGGMAVGEAHDRIKISPLARRLASDKGIDLRELRGTGPGGRIHQRDVINFRPSEAPGDRRPEGRQPSGQPGAPAPVFAQRAASGSKEVVPLTKIRAVIAQRLQQSKQQIPHFYETVDADVTELAAMRERVNKTLENSGVRISVGDFVAKAVATALLRHRVVNAHFNAERNEVTQFGDVHLGMAVALENGLIVPVLRNIDQMGLAEIRVKSADLVDRARAQRLKQEELTGATFTVSNLGTHGIREFSAIINPPEVGILAIGAAERRPVVRGDAIVPRLVMSLTLSADHRVVDGATAADFLRTLKQLLEEPAMMLV